MGLIAREVVGVRTIKQEVYARRMREGLLGTEPGEINVGKSIRTRRRRWHYLEPGACEG